MFNDKTSTYSSLAKCDDATLHIRAYKTLASEVFKSLNNVDPNFMKKMLQVKYITNDIMRLKYVMSTKVQYDKNTFKYYRKHIWNDFPITSDEKGLFVSRPKRTNPCHTKRGQCIAFYILC